jgi:hypothetical protein
MATTITSLTVSLPAIMVDTQSSSRKRPLVARGNTTIAGHKRQRTRYLAMSGLR